MANWIGVITNAGNNLLAEWVNGKLLTFEHAAAGSGTVPAEALQTQTALTAQKQTVHIMGSERVSNGIRLKLRITAPQTGYTLNQFGIWAKLGEVTTMIALFQHNQGIPIPSANEAPDFVYTFFATVMASNMGNWTIRVDPSALATMQDLEKKLDRAGGTMTGDLYMNGYSIYDAEDMLAKRGRFSDGVLISGPFSVSEKNGSPLFALSGYQRSPGHEIVAELYGNQPGTSIIICGVAAPKNGNEAANKGYVDGEIKKHATSLLHSPPTESTSGEIGQFAIDQDTGLIYKCVMKTHDGRYRWEPIFSGGDITKTLNIKGERIFFEDSDGNPVFFIRAYGGKMFIGGSTPGNRVVVSGVDDPQNSDDAANRNYVDNQIATMQSEIARLEKMIKTQQNK